MDEAQVLFQTWVSPEGGITTPLEGIMRQDIYLIHGFHGKKYSHYRDNLVRLVKDSVFSLAIPGNALLTGREFSFHGSLVPQTGKAVLENAVLKLRQCVFHNLRQASMNEDLSDLEHKTTSTVRHDIVSANDLQMNTILFIAHGFGSWVVRDALAHPSSHGITYLYGRVGVDFINLDLPKGYSTAYGEYVKQNWKQFFDFSSPPDGQEFHELISYLQEIDENFSAMMYKASDNTKSPLAMVVKPQMTYRGQHLDVWMSDNRDFIRPARIGRYPSLLTLLGRKMGPIQDDFIIELPTFQGVMQRSFSNLMSLDSSETSASQQEPAMSGPFTTPTPASIHGAEASAHDTPAEVLHAGAPPTADSEPRISENDKQSVYKEADSFLQMGELEKAYKLFTKLSEAYGRGDHSQAKIYIDMQVATVKMYRGDYMSSEKEFLGIHQRLEDYGDVHRKDQWAVEHQNLCQRRLANCLLLAGKWDKAATKIRSLLDEDPKRFNVRLCRDLALAYAYLGQYTEARETLELAQKRSGDMKGNTNSSREHSIIRAQESTLPESNQERDLQTREATMDMAIATVKMLAGDYKEALKLSSHALDSMKRILGAKHFKTLAVAVLKSWCLVYNGKYIEAEALCLETYRATTRSLGRDHLQSLEAMGCLVHIFQCQGRFAEAIGTGISLEDLYSDRSTRYPDYIHPQAIHSKFLLGTAFLASGEYATSSKKLDEGLKLAEAHEMKHPEIFRYKSEKARALLYLGSIKEAQDLATVGAIEHFKLNTWSDGTMLEVGPHEEHLSRLNAILTELRQDAVLSTTLHPFLVSNLQILAKIEVRRYQLSGQKVDAAGFNIARDILETLQRYYSNMETPNIVFASSVNMDLAALYKEDPTRSDKLPKAIELLTEAYKDRKSHMGDNIDTLCALRELTIAQCLLDLFNPGAGATPLSRVKVVSNNILRNLESRLGKTHQETIASQLWYLAVDYLLSDDDDNNIREKMVEDLIKNLSDPWVLKERFIETLLMRKTLAGFLKVTDNHEKAVLLIDGAITELDEALMNANKAVEETTIRNLRMTFVELKESANDENIGP